MVAAQKVLYAGQGALLAKMEIILSQHSGSFGRQASTTLSMGVKNYVDLRLPDQLRFFQQWRMHCCGLRRVMASDECQNNMDIMHSVCEGRLTF